MAQSKKAITIDTVEIESSEKLIDLGQTTAFSAQKPTKSWKPWSLRSPFLLSSILANLLLVILLAFLLRKNTQEGGIYFAVMEQDVSDSANFLFSYFPTIFAVLYSTLWNWVDLDTKRLEPWFQMSSETGASGRDSILLKYPAQFLALVPLHAARRR